MSTTCGPLLSSPLVFFHSLSYMSQNNCLDNTRHRKGSMFMGAPKAPMNGRYGHACYVAFTKSELFCNKHILFLHDEVALLDQHATGTHDTNINQCTYLYIFDKIKHVQRQCSFPLSLKVSHK